MKTQRKTKNSIKRILELIKADRKRNLRPPKPKKLKLFGITDLGFFRKKKIDGSRNLRYTKGNIGNYGSRVVDIMTTAATLCFVGPIILDIFKEPNKGISNNLETEEGINQLILNAQ